MRLTDEKKHRLVNILALSMEKNRPQQGGVGEGRNSKAGL